MAEDKLEARTDGGSKLQEEAPTVKPQGKSARRPSCAAELEQVFEAGRRRRCRRRSMIQTRQAALQSQESELAVSTTDQEGNTSTDLPEPRNNPEGEPKPTILLTHDRECTQMGGTFDVQVSPAPALFDYNNVSSFHNTPWTFDNRYQSGFGHHASQDYHQGIPVGLPYHQAYLRDPRAQPYFLEQQLTAVEVVHVPVMGVSSGPPFFPVPRLPHMGNVIAISLPSSMEGILVQLGKLSVSLPRLQEVRTGRIPLMTPASPASSEKFTSDAGITEPSQDVNICSLTVYCTNASVRQALCSDSAPGSYRTTSWLYASPQLRRHSLPEADIRAVRSLKMQDSGFALVRDIRQAMQDDKAGFIAELHRVFGDRELSRSNKVRLG